MRRMSKVLAGIAAGLTVMSMVAGCGSSEGAADKPQEKEDKVKEYIDESQYDELYTNPDKFKGKYVKL